MDYHQFDDEALIRLIAHAQSDALSELYDRYNRLVFGLALNAVSDRGLAEEITQDVFMRIWEHANTYQSGYGRVLNWVASIARNRAIDMLRHRLSSTEGHSLGWDDLPQFDPPDSLDVEQQTELDIQKLRIRQALYQLPKEQRDALAMVYFRGHTQEEAAEALGEPLGTVKTRIRLGMQKLKTIFDQKD